MRVNPTKEGGYSSQDHRTEETTRLFGGCSGFKSKQHLPQEGKLDNESVVRVMGIQLIKLKTVGLSGVTWEC